MDIGIAMAGLSVDEDNLIDTKAFSPIHIWDTDWSLIKYQKYIFLFKEDFL